MKIAINRCFGEFNLSKKAVKRMAELQGKECYFFEGGLSDSYKEITIDDKENLCWFAFSTKNPNEDIGESFTDEDGTYTKYNALFKKYNLTNDSKDRTDALLIQVVEELGREASGRCADIKIIEIPDDVDWVIDEYDGMETVHEKHRSWW